MAYHVIEKVYCWKGLEDQAGSKGCPEEAVRHHLEPNNFMITPPHDNDLNS